MLSSRIQFILFFCTITKRIWGLTNEEKEILVAEHNNLRSQVSPSAADMLEMTWDTSLESFAKAYTAKCLWAHDAENKDKGENLYATTMNSLDVEKAVQEWYDERQNYDFDTNYCNEDKMCGHYTQVVWATSEKVGCHEHFCNTLHGLDGENWFLLMCYYHPGGNYEEEKPYTHGIPCEQCPEGYECISNLCTTPKQITSQVPSTKTMSSQAYSTVAPTTLPSTETTSSEVSWTNVLTTLESTEAVPTEASWPAVPTKFQSTETTASQVSWTDIPTQSPSTETIDQQGHWPMTSDDSEMAETTASQVSWTDIPTQSPSTETIDRQGHWPMTSYDSEMAETTARQVSRTDIPTQSPSTEASTYREYWSMNSTESEFAETMSAEVSQADVSTNSQSTDIIQQEEDMHSLEKGMYDYTSSAVQSYYSHLSFSLTLLLMFYFV
ncbi:peptidase inhibitor 16-like isoform X2 [Protopterus annectens]|uniref:peptidase inhibitor 16-like isoform X2 n=1 Tax=Protopterus annectens TaxID=7888 RepID=UPI001CFB1D8E|nr:peptidase inhibitor 16-like isoform X2 [Protopterus annectens]